MRRELIIEINPDGSTLVKSLSTTPNHHLELRPFTDALSDGDKKQVIEHVHEHAPDGSHIIRKARS